MSLLHEMARVQDTHEVRISWGACGRSHEPRSAEEFLVDSNAPLVKRGRFGLLSSDAKTSLVRPNRAPSGIDSDCRGASPARIAVPVSGCRKPPQKGPHQAGCVPSSGRRGLT